MRRPDWPPWSTISLGAGRGRHTVSDSFGKADRCAARIAQMGDDGGRLRKRARKTRMFLRRRSNAGQPVGERPGRWQAHGVVREFKSQARGQDKVILLRKINKPVCVDDRVRFAQADMGVGDPDQPGLRPVRHCALQDLKQDRLPAGKREPLAAQIQRAAGIGRIERRVNKESKVCAVGIAQMQHGTPTGGRAPRPAAVLKAPPMLIGQSAGPLDVRRGDGELDVMSWSQCRARICGIGEAGLLEQEVPDAMFVKGTVQSVGRLEQALIVDPSLAFDAPDDIAIGDKLIRMRQGFADERQQPIRLRARGIDVVTSGPFLPGLDSPGRRRKCGAQQEA